MLKNLHPHITKLKQKLFSTKQRAIITILVFAIVGIGITVVYNHFAKGATYGWMQSSWSGNADTGSVANHTNNQNGWNKFFSKNNNISADSQITLNSTNLTKTDTTTANFQTGTNTNGTYPILNTNNELKLDIPTCNTTPSNAGADQTGAPTCGLTTVTLNGNAPTVGTGSWTKVSGTGGTFANANLRNTTFTGTAGLTYVLRWTITNVPCPASTDDVTITFNQNPGAAGAIYTGTCVNQGQNNVAYSIPAVNGATSYTWNYTGTGFTITTGINTRSITADFSGLATSGNLIVTPVNVCGSGTARTLAITVLASCGQPIVVNHIAGIVAPVTKTVTYGTVATNATGVCRCWITQNLGADYQATSMSESTEASAGWYWQFNRKQGYKHDGTTRTPATTWVTTPVAGDWSSANDPCTIELGSNWRIPTNLEWNGNNSSNSTLWNAIRVHYGGYLLNTTGALQYRGIVTKFWSSTIYSTSAWYLDLNANSGMNTFMGKNLGTPIRCLKN